VVVRLRRLGHRGRFLVLAHRFFRLWVAAVRRLNSTGGLGDPTVVCDDAPSTVSALGGITGAGSAGGGAIAGGVGVNSGFTDADLSGERSQAAMPTAIAIATSRIGVCARFTNASARCRT
jgi:hypothetical protein